MRVSRRRLLGVALPVVLGLGLSGLIVWQASYSAFSTTTSNNGNNWTTATVGLSNDSGGTPMFTVSNIAPGATGNRCIQISSTSTVPSAVKLYTAIGAAPSNDISQYINVQIEQGTGGTFASCSGFTPSGTAVYNGPLSTLTSTYTNFGNGLGPWSLTGTNLPERLSYRVTWTFSSSAPSSTQTGTTPSVTFTWEAQNT